MSSPRVQLPQGTVVGAVSREKYPHAVEFFKGIPYALPPTGERRFRPPEKVGKSQDTMNATKFGPRAPAQQLMTIGPKLEESEDCLTANVFRQAGHDQSKPLPVAVYFHAGAFNRGNAAMHDTAAMVGWSEQPFIAVSFGYRIGALGFLPSRLSAKEGALNLGLKDQICLLDWVEENIGHFGGDKDCVTLIGLSAGAHSVGVVLGSLCCFSLLIWRRLVTFYLITRRVKHQNSIGLSYNLAPQRPVLCVNQTQKSMKSNSRTS